MRRILGRYIFQIYPDRSLSEMISRLAEIDAMDNVEMSIDAVCDLDLEYEALEDTIERLIVSREQGALH